VCRAESRLTGPTTSTDAGGPEPRRSTALTRATSSRGETELQPEETVHLVVARSDEQHRRPVARLAQRPADSEAVEDRQADVEHERNGPHRPCRHEHGPAVGLDLHAEACPGEVQPLELSDRGLVLTDEDETARRLRGVHGSTVGSTC
jgi:hypothetical protein